MVKVCLRWNISNIHSGFPFQYEVSETTTIGEICQKVIATNYEWLCSNMATQKFNIVKICGNNNTFLDDSQIIGGDHYENECYLVFVAG
jgi:hypothetical protein